MAARTYHALSKGGLAMISENQKTFIVFAVHAHQPYFQFPEVRETIYQESYLPFLRVLEKYPHARVSLSLTKSAGEWLPREFFEKIRALTQGKKIELLVTSAYHYILPLMPPEVIENQLRASQAFCERRVQVTPARGVFLPELAFTPETAQAIGDLGFLWTIADDALFGYCRRNLPPHLRVPNNWIPMSRNCAVFLRAHDRSEDIARGRYENGRAFLRRLIHDQQSWRNECGITGPSYIVLVVDMETFGHHPPKDSLERFLESFFDGAAEFCDTCELAFFSSLLSQFPKRKADIPPGSWATSREDFEQKSYFPLWNHRDNPFHRAWNEFAQVVFSLARLYSSQELADFIQKIFGSCTPWQYSHGKNALARLPFSSCKRVIALLPSSVEKEHLASLLETMDALTR